MFQDLGHSFQRSVFSHSFLSIAEGRRFAYRVKTVAFESYFLSSNTGLLLLTTKTVDRFYLVSLKVSFLINVVGLIVA